MKGYKNMTKYHQNTLQKVLAVIVVSCFMLFGLTACTDNKEIKDNNALIQGVWEIDTGSGAGWKFEDNKFGWVKSIQDFDDNYWYGDVEIYSGAEAMEIAGLTKEELERTLPSIDSENIFVLKLDPEKIINEGEDKTATNMSDDTLWTHLWIIEETNGKALASVVDLNTFKIDTYTKVD
ncbi:MAG: hypothetical protein ACLT3H_00805 [Roseburia sp.]